jgi:hypothetical protein
MIKKIPFMLRSSKHSVAFFSNLLDFSLQGNCVWKTCGSDAITNQVSPFGTALAYDKIVKAANKPKQWLH